MKLRLTHQLESSPATQSRSTLGVASFGANASPATKPTQLNKPRRNGLLMAAPSAREKQEPQRFCKAIGTTGTGMACKSFITPALNSPGSPPGVWQLLER
jgi:hypothetical protein